MRYARPTAFAKSRRCRAAVVVAAATTAAAVVATAPTPAPALSPLSSLRAPVCTRRPFPRGARAAFRRPRARGRPAATGPARASAAPLAAALLWGLRPEDGSVERHRAMPAPQSRGPKPPTGGRRPGLRPGRLPPIYTQGSSTSSAWPHAHLHSKRGGGRQARSTKTNCKGLARI